MIKSICIFCGARPGTKPVYREQAERLGHLLGRYGVDVVYGGGHIGLMGVVADAAMASGGKVTGYIPGHLLEREVGHRDISELVVTNNMFDRKEQMIDQAGAFAILPGGLGTLDEFFEVLTLSQLEQHRKPIILINVDGFWDPLMSLIDQVISGGFADADVKTLFQLVNDADAMLPALGIGNDQTAVQAAS